MSVVNLEKGGIELTLILTFKKLLKAPAALTIVISNIFLLNIKVYLSMESKRGASDITGSATATGSGSAATTPPANPTHQWRRGAGSRLTNLTGTLAGCARSTPRCQGPLGPAVTRDSGPSGTGTPVNSRRSGVALAVTPASVVALAATPALVAASAATPAATLGSGEATRPLSSSKPLSLYIYVLVFYSPLYVLRVPSLLFSFLSNRAVIRPICDGCE